MIFLRLAGEKAGMTERVKPIFRAALAGQSLLMGAESKL